MPTAGRPAAATLLDILLDAARETPGQTVVHVRGDGVEHTVTFARLRDDALRVAGGLRAAGLAPGTPVPLLAEHADAFQPLFWGALAAGLVPVPLAPDARRAGPVWEFLGRPPLLVDETTAALRDALPGPVRSLELGELRTSDPLAALPRRDPGDLAFLQFSSGSTGAPKGVELNHEAVLANLRQIRSAMAITPDDVIATWMPYFHDMGLIGTHLVPMAAGLRQVRLEPPAFARRPALWLETAARHRATLLSAANFALALVNRRVPEETWARLDLGAVRLMLVGAEPIAPRVWREFIRRAAPSGLDPRAMLPVYGLAEATLAVTVPPLGERAEPLRLDRRALSRGRAVPARPGPDTVEFMDVGRPVPDCAVRITGAAGESVGDGRVGRVEVRGPQVARGYHREPEAGAAAFADGWLRTGDLGFLREGRLCVTGRHKDVVFVDGRTFHAADLEETAAATPGLPGGTVAVIGSADPDTGRDRVAVFVQWARPAPAEARPVLAAVTARVREALGHGDIRVLPLPPGAFPRTTSGKLRRALMRDRFEAGAYAPVAARWVPATRAAAEPAAEPVAEPVADGREGVRGGVRGTGDAAPDGPSAGRPEPAGRAEPGGERHESVTGVRTRAGVPLSRREVEDAVRRIWARVLDLDPADIGPNDRFPALGGSSLKAMTVLAALEDDLSVTVEPRVLRDHDTVTALAAQLLGRVGRDAGGAARGSATGQDAGLAQEGGDGNGSLPVQESAVAASPVPGAAVSAAGARDGLAAPAAPAAPDAAAVPHPLAVLGMSCRFPGAETPEEFWQLLLSGRDVTGDAPAERLRWTPDLAGHAGAFLAAPADFDAGFFGMDDEEARATDPQARMFLELAHEALERAGYAGPRRAGRRVGVFAAVGDSGYRDVLAGAADGDVAGHPGALTGNLPSLTAARLSQFLDLDGPALAVDTACSSALTALHLARRSLAGGECDIAVVGGVQLALTATGHRLLARAGALSPTGRSRPFGAGADGIVPGEGGAVLVLARLTDAERAGDPVLALVRGTAVTNDGRSLGLLAPNPRTQHEVITRAYAECGIDPAEVAYVEAHGTGTPIGDPVEAQSLGRAFPPRPDGRPRPLGSVKANLGHLLNAAGLPALVKTVLALHHREVPPTPHAASAAPYLDRLAPGFVLAAERTELTGTGPLIAGVNAFGFGGTNAHAVLEQAPRRRSETVPPAEGPRLLRLSARHADALREAAGDLAVFVRAHPELSEPGIVAAVDTARDDAPHRLAVVADGDLADRLDAARAAGGAVARSRPRTVFLLPGQGAQRPGQGRALYRAAPAFREVLDEASSLTGPVRGRALADWCLDPRTDPLDLARTEVAQPLLVAYGVGLARQLARWGAIPDAVAGHSVGEIAAACVSGSLTLAEAVGFAAERGRLMGELARPGAMAAVRADEDTVAALVAESGGALWISAVNGPGHVVVSGTEDAVARALAELTGRGTAARRLRVSHAFHCPLVEPVLDPLREAAKALSAGSAAVPMLSTLTAAWAPDLGPAHWRRHAAEPVRFGAAAARLLDEGYDTFVELGPGSTLGGAVRAAAAAHDAPDVAVLTTGTPDAADASEVRALLETAGRLWTRGVALDRAAGAAGRPRVPVPTYPFRRTRYWPRRSGAGGPVRRVVWQEAPPTSARPPRAVRLAGTGGPLRRALAERLTARGLTVLGDDAPGDGGADTLVWLTGEHPAADVSAAVATLRAVLGALPADCSRLLLVTHDAHATGGERAHPERALPHGFALALSDEHPGLTAHGVDLSARDTVTERADALVREVHAAPDPGGSVAWRAGRRLGRRPQALPEPSAAPDALPADGTYLITGGAGGLGSALARDLAGRGAREVILTGRTEAAPGELLAELCDLGTRARYVSADATDAAAVDALVAGLPPLDGLFHAAGTAGPGTLRGKSDAEIERTLAVKVRGTLLLAEALTRHGQEPAVRVVFSSVSSVLPGLAGALGDYAAANAFLDAFAAAEHAAGRPWRSIGFGPVAGAGLAAGALPEARLRALGLTALTPADAIGALRTAVATGAPHLLAAPARPAGAATPVPAAPRPAPRTEAGADSLPSAPAGAPGPADGAADPTAGLIRRLLAEALHRAPGEIGDHEPFLALGLDSLTAVDLARRLESELGLPLSATLLFEHRTIGELATHLAAQSPPADAAPPHAPAPHTPPDTPRPAPRMPRGAAQSATPAPDTPSPLTALQRAFLTTEALYEGVTAHGYLRQTVRGPLDAGLLGLALAAVAARHPMLRLRVTGGTSPRQYTAPAGPADRAPDWYEVHEPGDRTDPGRVLADLEQHLYNRPFDLTAESPVRAVLVRDRRDPHLAHLLLAVHHGAADGFSLKILCEDLWSLYTALTEGRPVSELPLPQADFADHTALADAQRRSAGFARDQRYWRDRLARHTPREAARALPYDADPDTPPAPPFTHHQTTLDPALGAALREVAARHEVSLFHLLLAAYTRCLSRWGGGPSVAVNVARARREAPLPGIERLVGPLADTLPVLVAVGADEPLPALARRLRGIWREAEAHGSLTSPDIAALLPSGGAAPRTAAAAGFSFARFPVRHGLGRPVEVTPAAAATASAATRLSLLCWEADAALHFSWNHPARLFHRETVERLAAEYSAELQRVAEEFGATGQESGGAGIVARLSARFRAAAGSVAVDTGDTTLTYAELDTASAALAARLRAHGVRPGDLVGLLTERGADTVLGVVGILRAGAGWVPLDPSHPAARLQEQLTRTGARTVVCHAATRATAAALDGVSPVPADVPGPAPAAGLPDVPADPDALAYVIFTSGSTGRPKAVPITHRSLLAYLDWALTAFGYHAGDRLLQTASPCFDASVRQLLAPLLVGARVHTLTQDDLRDPDTLLDRVVNDRITVWSSVPTLWERLITAAELRAPREGAPPDLSALRWVHVGGEALPPAHVRRWFDLLGDRAGAGHRVSNLYGPTEATINATCHIIDARPGDDVRTLPIGRPVAGTELAVVDEEGHPCAPGEEGHLLIAGTGLTPGYLGEPGLTEAAFTERDGRRWYRSGDRVRRTDDGVLEYLGRLDDQVKVRGHRVEPGEVEAALLTLPDVARAAVLLVGGRLAAYLEPRAGAAGPDARAVRAALARTLPPYMVPGRVHTLAAMPLTGTGKIDRTRLPHRPGDHTRPGGDDHSGADDRSGPAAGDHDGSAVVDHDGPAPGELGGPATGRQGIPASGDHDNPAAGDHDGPASGGHDAPVTPRPRPATPTEQLLARVWSDLLDVPEVARDDDFFQLGGDSIMVLELFARLRAELPRVPRPTTLYTHRTLAALATALDAAHTADPAPADRTPPTPADAPYPLTPSQRGFLLAEAVDPGAAPVWLARFRLSGPLRPDVLQRAVDVLVARHPMLRTVFPAGARPPVQQELPASLRLPVQRETLTGGPARLEQRIAEEARRELEPWTWPLLRLRLFTLAADEHVLLVHAHHLIGDGYSAALLARELLTAYGNLEHGRPHGLPPLTGTFRDHVTRSAARQRPHGPDADAHRARLREPYTPPVLRAPAAGEPASRQGFHTSGFTLDAAATRAVRRLARAAGTTAHAPLLTAYYQALAELTGQRDLMVGLAVTGREDSTPDAHRVFGPFAQAVTLRPSPPSGPRQERTPAFADDVRLLAAESALARTEGPSAPRTASGLPRHAQFFFTFLDFTSLGPVGGGGPTLRTDDSDTSLAPPPLGTDVFLAARPLSGDAGLRVTLRASAAALTDRQARDLAEDIRRRLLDGAAGPARAPRRTGLDAALVGYLPSPRDLAAFAGLPDGIPGLGREEIRASLFPDGRARLLERTGTPLGESGFVALPLFGDELAGAGDLAARTARAVEHAASLGARSVSLAGMIPSLTGYGHDVLRESGTRAAITTGHATTTVAVARTVRAALAASGRDLGDLTLAVVGCGSIGVSSLRLLLATSPRPPARLLLCDLPGGADRLRRLAADLSRAHPATPVRVVESGRRLPAEAYEADVLVTAVSGAGNLVDVARLRPGTVLVDDSFPHCFDTARALDRMSTAGDVLVLGGGLLALDSTATRLSEDLPPAAATGFAARPAIADTLASCRLESLLHAHLADRPGRLAPVHGLVDLPRALAHWDAAEAAGVRAAPLHLLDRVLADADGRHVRRADSSPAPDRGGSPCR